MKIKFEPAVKTLTEARELIIKHVCANGLIEEKLIAINADYDMGFITKFERDNQIVDEFINSLPETDSLLIIKSK